MHLCDFSFHIYSSDIKDSNNDIPDNINDNIDNILDGRVSKFICPIFNIILNIPEEMLLNKYP